ncbi:MAG: hypothetical protein ABR509_01050 [Candidatus Limnocylindria bacterium]
MTMDRGRRGALALVATVLWLGYMIVGLQVIDVVMPTRAGAGPEGAAAFVGLVGGIVWAGIVMWAASE